MRWIRAVGERRLRTHIDRPTPAASALAVSCVSGCDLQRWSTELSGSKDRLLPYNLLLAFGRMCSEIALPSTVLCALLALRVPLCLYLAFRVPPARVT